jgi:UDP-2,3-diacylglucosamine pyrophosphatase LpxH
VAPRRYLIVSDTHLSDVEEHADGWKRFKSAAFLRDEDFRDLIGRFLAEHDPNDELVLVLNGDIFDFCITTLVPDDPPWPLRRRERTRGLEPTEAKAAWKLERILEQHPAFLSALVSFMEQGHRVIYVLGNHDHELHWASVQRVLVRALHAHASASARVIPEQPILFEPWFYYDPDGLYVEHGHQYDIYSSFPHILSPTSRLDGEEILALPLGGFSNRYLVSILGFFNPRSTDYICNLPGYFAHWLRFYAFSRRSILFGWFLGTAMVLVRVMRLRFGLWRQAQCHARGVTETARRFGLSWLAVWQLDQLKPTPIYFRTFRIVREFWLDRVLLILGLLALTGAGQALVPGPLALRLLPFVVGSTLLVWLYERSVATSGVFTVNEEAPGYAQAITELLPVKVVAMGHTHQPALVQLSPDSFFVNTGTWAPQFTWRAWHGPDPGSRHALFVTLDEGRVSLDLQVLPSTPGGTCSSVVPMPMPGGRFEDGGELPGVEREPTRRERRA